MNTLAKAMIIFLLIVTGMTSCKKAEVAPRPDYEILADAKWANRSPASGKSTEYLIEINGRYAVTVNNRSPRDLMELMIQVARDDRDTKRALYYAEAMCQDKNEELKTIQERGEDFIGYSLKTYGGQVSAKR